MPRLPRVLATLTLLACGAPDPAPAPRRAPALVRVVTWNVHDLFDPEDRLTPPGERDLVPSAAEVDVKLDAVAAVLRRVDADVVLLQEVENAAVLGALAARAGYAEARLVEGADPRGIDVAALAKAPILAYVSHQDDRDASGAPLWPRDCVEVHLAPARGRRLVVVGSHLSSTLSDDGTRRAEQAARMRAIADAAAAAGALVLAGGDLNDGTGSAALAPLLGDGAWVEPLAGAPLDAAWTWSDGGRRAVLDHLAVARADAGAVLDAVVVGGPDVGAASDHRPVVLELWVE